jgi:hypothetical protein
VGDDDSDEDSDYDSDDEEDGKAEKMRKNQRIQILKSSGHRRPSIDLVSLLMKGVQAKRVESAFSKAARKVMDGEDPVEVENWERRALAEEKILDWFRTMALEKLQEMVRLRKIEGKQSSPSMSADMRSSSNALMMASGTIHADVESVPSTSPEFSPIATTKAPSDVDDVLPDPAPHHDKKRSYSVNVGAVSSSQWKDLKQSAASRQSDGETNDLQDRTQQYSNSPMNQLRRVSVQMPVKGGSSQRAASVGAKSKPAPPTLDARQINALMSYGNVQNRRKSGLMGPGRKKSRAKKTVASMSAAGTPQLTMPRLDSVSKMMLDNEGE